MIEKYKESLISDDWNAIDVEVFNDFLDNHWIKIPKQIWQIEDITKSRIENILGTNNALSNLLMLLVNYKLIQLSDNIWNNFEKEKEIKILDVNTSELWKQLLEEWWAVKTFEGRVTDTYFDTENKDIEKWTYNNWEKSSLRIRHKVPKWENHWDHYCTIKKKDKKSEDQNELRDCYEEEFILFNSIIFYKLLKILELNEYKMKVKNRVAYSLWGIKFDFDKYKGIPNLLEIEAASWKIAQNYINHLWLEWNEKLNGWSSSLFKHYWKKLKTFF